MATLDLITRRGRQRLLLRDAVVPSKSGKVEAEFLRGDFRYSPAGMEFPATLHTALLIANIYRPGVSSEVKDWIQSLVHSSSTAEESFLQNVPPHLREYQRRGVEFLSKRRGALLADSVGLGKTIQAIAAAPVGKARRLVVCPNHLKGWWYDQIREYYPDARIGVCGQGRNAVTQMDVAATEGVWDWNIVHWEAIWMKSNLSLLRKVVWDVIIADEAHRIKNRKTKTADALKSLRARRRWALTATPYANLPADLFSILQWLNPEVYSSYWKFYAVYTQYVPGPYAREEIGPKNCRTLAWELEDVMLRRSVEDVLDEVPPTTHTTLSIEMQGEQHRTYEIVRKQTYIELEGAGRLSIPNAVARLVRLRQVCIDPSLIGMPGDPAKIEALSELLEMSDEPCVVFTTFRNVATKAAYMIDGLEAYVGGEGPEVIVRFQEGQAAHIIGTIAAMGEGFNLQRARRVIFIDLPWSQVQYQQAIGRVRPGLNRRPVEIISIEAKESIDQFIREVLDGKISGAEQVYSALSDLLKGEGV
jgi:SNF2 family DNA or RNA helicase